MKLHEMKYEQFWMERLSWDVPVHFSKEEIQWAVDQTEHKYFGSYELTDQQQMAVDILVWAAKESIG